jgi:hypothetical protein
VTMTNGAFAEFCAAHRICFFEKTAGGELVILPPPYTLRGVRNWPQGRGVVRVSFEPIRDLREKWGRFVPKRCRKSPLATR